MSNLFLGLLGLLFLLGGVFWGARRWIQPRRPSLSIPAQALLLLIILTLMGGFIGAPFWWFDEPASFSWDVPPLASRMLASAGWAFVVPCYVALQKPTDRRLRLVLWLLFVYLTPLAIAIVLFHLDRFDPRAPITYVFFVIVVGMVVSTAYYLWRQPVVLPVTPQQTPVLWRNWLWGTAVICAVWGIALFVTDSGPKLIWAWPGDLLSSRLIGVMLLAIATGNVYSASDKDTSRMMLATLLTYSVGISLAGLWNGLAGKPIPLSYVIVFGLMGVGSAVLSFRPQK